MVTWTALTCRCTWKSRSGLSTGLCFTLMASGGRTHAHTDPNSTNSTSALHLKHTQAKEYKAVDGGEGGIQLPAHQMLTTPVS